MTIAKGRSSPQGVGDSRGGAARRGSDDDDDDDDGASSSTNANDDDNEEEMPSPLVVSLDEGYNGIVRGSSPSAPPPTYIDARDHFTGQSLKAPTAGLHQWAAMVRDKLRDDGDCAVSTVQIERIRVIHDMFYEGARFSFNYNTLILCASVISALGLVGNSTATVIASMLISPIMGPVVGMGYGSSIHDWKLIKISLITETVSLLFCIVTGMVIGAIVSATEWAKTENFPTSKSSGNMNCFLWYMLLCLPFDRLRFCVTASACRAVRQTKWYLECRGRISLSAFPSPSFRGWA